ncbi:MAG: nucleotidyltransferase family protein [Chloroflexota bacterium]|nr:nucleotidyltransferase family protein [Chloroflexota bacterium]MDP9470268.1 nucleotidyltransferase family protein [Chloroflexota bacterium]
MFNLAPDLPLEEIAALCRRYRVRELSLFGSALRDDFRPDSDLDLLVEFEPTAGWSLFDLVDMQDELGALMGRSVDLIERPAIEGSYNWIRRREILGTARPIYVAG